MNTPLTEVAVHAPMKRGLKDAMRPATLGLAGCSSPCPDEKGTESVNWWLQVLLIDRSSPCPDEKGTESYPRHSGLVFNLAVAVHAPMKRGLKVDFPPGYLSNDSIVAVHAPMKRGLKVSDSTAPGVPLTGSSPCPDEKGTESRRT